MRLLTMLSILLISSGCAAPETWTRQDVVLQSLVTATYVIDGLQTSDIQYHPDIREGGMAKHALGSQPSTSDTWQYMASVSIVSALVTHWLPAKWRPYWQGGLLAVQAKSIISNCALGLGRICEEDHDHEHSFR